MVRQKEMNTGLDAVGAHKLEPHAKDKAVAKRLWEVSEEGNWFKVGIFKSKIFKA